MTTTSDTALYLSNDDLYLLGAGEWYRSYEKLGSHPATDASGQDGYHFAVWAPDVCSVAVIGEFNDWDESANRLSCTATGGVWQGFVPGVAAGQLYKYVIETAAGERLHAVGTNAAQANDHDARPVEPCEPLLAQNEPQPVLCRLRLRHAALPPPRKLGTCSNLRKFGTDLNAPQLRIHVGVRFAVLAKPVPTLRKNEHVPNLRRR